MIRLLHTSSSYLPRIGGLPSWVRAVAYQTADVFEHHLLTRTLYGPGLEMPAGTDDRDPRLTVHRFKVPQGYLTDEMREFAQTFEYDALVIHSTNPHLLELAAPAKAGGHRVVFCPQTPTQIGIGPLLGDVDRMTVLLPSWVEHFADAHGYERSRITVLPRLVDLGWFPWDFRAGRAPTRLLYVGRFAPEKRVNLAVATLGKLRQRDQRYTLHIVGAPDSERRDIPPIEDAIARTHTMGAVTFARADTLSQVCAAYGRGDVLISASTQETFCQVFLEALSSGLGVATTATGGPREWCAAFPNAVQFADDPVDLVDAVLRAVPLDGDGYRRLAEEYSWQARRGEWMEAIRG